MLYFTMWMWMRVKNSLRHDDSNLLQNVIDSSFAHATPCHQVTQTDSVNSLVEVMDKIYVGTIYI